MKSETFIFLASFVSTIRSAALIPYNHELKEDPSQYVDDRPFKPFSDVGAAVAPVIRDDNTTKSRVPDDTLMADGHPEFAEGFDSLDNHFESQKQPEALGANEDVGNLHPDEVYYADDKLLIIKGGGFHVPYSDPEPEPQEEEYYDNHILGAPPNPNDEYNGNVATIVPPPPYKYSLFMPADLLRSGSQTKKSYVGARRRNEPHYMGRIPLRMESPITYEAKQVFIPFWVIYPKQTAPSYYPPVSFIDGNSIVEDNVITYPSLSFPTNPNFIEEPISLEGDTAVNYLDPRPPVNPDAEVINPKFRSSRTQPKYRRSRTRL